MSKNIVIPIDVKNREFYGSGALAFKLVENGYNVIICPIFELFKWINKMTPNILIISHAQYDSIVEKYYLQLKKAGTKIIMLNNEGAVFYNPEHILNRLDNRIITLIDHYFVWGENARYIVSENKPVFKNKIEISGYPAFDMLNKKHRHIFESTSKYVRLKYGNDFILINSNFISNKFDSEYVVAKSIFDKEEYEHSAKLLDSFLDMVFYLQKKMPNTTIIYRPHPSENHDFYKEKFSSLANVYVEHDGSVLNWIYNAKLVIHNGCTTGIEAFLMGKPVLAYRLIKNEEYECFLPNQISEECSSLEELSTLIREIYNNNFSISSEKKNLLKQYINNVEREAVQIIGSRINNIKTKELNKEILNEIIPFQSYLKSSLKTLLHPVRKLIDKEYKKLWDYHYQKVPFLKKKEFIDFFNEMKGICNYKYDLKVQKLQFGKNIIKLSKKK